MLLYKYRLTSRFFSPETPFFGGFLPGNSSIFPKIFLYLPDFENFGGVFVPETPFFGGFRAGNSRCKSSFLHIVFVPKTLDLRCFLPENYLFRGFSPRKLLISGVFSTKTPDLDVFRGENFLRKSCV